MNAPPEATSIVELDPRVVTPANEEVPDPRSVPFNVRASALATATPAISNIPLAPTTVPPSTVPRPVI